MNRHTLNATLLDQYPWDWFIMLLIIIPGAALYYSQTILAALLLALGVIISAAIAGVRPRKRVRTLVPWGLHPPRFTRAAKSTTLNRLWLDLYPFLVLSIALAWWGTTMTEHWVGLFNLSVLHRTLALSLSGGTILMLVLALVLGLQLHRIRGALTIVYAGLFAATLSAYYTQTLPRLLATPGGDLRVLSQHGNWTPTPWPLIFAATCLAIIGAALSAWPGRGHTSRTALLQESAIRSPIVIFWLISIIYIVAQAMLPLYSPTTVAITTVALPIVLLMLFAIEVNIKTIVVTLGTLLNLFLAALTIPFYAALWVFTKFGDTLTGIHMRTLHPLTTWLTRLRNWVTIQIEILRTSRQWLVAMTFEPSRNDLFKQDQDVRELADADLLGSTKR